MLLRELTYLRPLFVVAMVLSWNAILIGINSTPEPFAATSMWVLAGVNLALAVMAGCAKSGNGWARALVIREEADFSQARAILWIITFFSLAFAILGALTATGHFPSGNG